MKKIMLVFGTRPEAIKMCPVIHELRRRKAYQVMVCVTGQHRELLDEVLKAFHVQADYDLSIMEEGQTLFHITERVLNGMSGILKKERPDLLLVHGDTTTSFASALAAFYLQIPVAHVEAGLRTYNQFSPYPEEFNRQAVGIISTLHFSPTEEAKANLLREGKEENSIIVTGNTAIDALRTTVREDYTHPELTWALGSRLVLLTAHRRENQGEKLTRIFRGIRRSVDEHEDVKLIYPVHPNPKVRATAHAVLSGHERIHLIEPLNVIDFHNFISRSYIILTDSGGIQEEAPSLNKPVLVLRDITERPEGVSAGTLLLAGTEENAVYRAFNLLLDDQTVYSAMCAAENPYGDGFASERISDAIQAYLD